MTKLSGEEKIRLANRIIAADREKFSVDARIVDYEDLLMDMYFGMADSTLISMANQVEAEED